MSIQNSYYVHQHLLGANYIEASDPLGKADENMKLKIARREAKETVFWLQLLSIHADSPLAPERNRLVNESI